MSQDAGVLKSKGERRAYEFLKRPFDVLCSAVLLVLFSPLFLVVAIIVKMDSTGPVFFRQKRVGRLGRIFHIVKFRTMVQNASSLGPLVTSKDDRRVTRVGRLLRAWKIDELPQFYNVLVGDMSLVGPRPQVEKYVELFPPVSREVIFSVRPGITGPAAIKFRHEEEILENRADRERFYIDVLLPIKCNIDVEYVRDRNAIGDIKLLFETAKILIGGLIHRLTRAPIKRGIDYPIPNLAVVERASEQSKESSSH